MIALYPVLQFARLIAGVGANLEHGDDHDLHGNGFWLCSGLDGKQEQKEGSKECCPAHRHGAMVPERQ
jgi:hypothetical protein